MLRRVLSWMLLGPRGHRVTGLVAATVFIALTVFAVFLPAFRSSLLVVLLAVAVIYAQSLTLVYRALRYGPDKSAERERIETLKADLDALRPPSGTTTR